MVLLIDIDVESADEPLDLKLRSTFIRYQN